MQLSSTTVERDNLREDLKGHKDSKRESDNSYRQQKTRADKLDKELLFYQEQSAKAMKDRDQVSFLTECINLLSQQIRSQESCSCLSRSMADSKQLKLAETTFMSQVCLSTDPFLCQLIHSRQSYSG